ncbi:hypothetical protein ElyMa_004458100, partial [Elysia marginata]
PAARTPELLFFTCNFPIHDAVWMRIRKTWRGVQPDHCVDGALKTPTALRRDCPRAVLSQV